MYRALIINLGFDEKFAIRALTRHGISKGDRVILLTGPRVERVEKAASYVRVFLDKYHSGEAHLELVSLPIGDFYDAVSEAMKIIEKVLDADEIIVNLSGGMRITTLAIFTALLFMNPENLVLELESEDTSTYLTLDVKVLRSLLTIKELSEEKKDILKVLMECDGSITVHELSSMFNRDESTIRKHLRELKDKGYIIIKKRKPLIVEKHPVLKIIFKEDKERGHLRE